MCLSRLQVILSKVSEVFIDLYWYYTVSSTMEKTRLKFRILYSISNNVSATGTPTPLAI